MDVLETFQPELLILDIHMPGCNGMELASVLRQHPHYASLPILFLSGEPNLGRRLSDRNLAHEDYLIKPVLPAALIRAVNGGIHRARARLWASEHMRTSLRELENLQFALNQHAIVSATDVAGRITYVNEKFCKISGYAPHELVGRTHRLVTSGYHPRAFFKEMWDTVTRGKVWHGQVKNRRRDGTFYWVEATIVPFIGENGKPSEYVSIRTDISHQKEVEERARSMALFAEMNPAPVLRLDTEGHILEANLAAITNLNIQPDASGTLVGEMPGFARINLKELIREGRHQGITQTIGAHWFRFQFQGVPELNVCHVYGSDITDVHKAEDALRQSEARIRAIVESSREGIVLIGETGRIELANPAAGAMFGRVPSEMAGIRLERFLPAMAEAPSDAHTTEPAIPTQERPTCRLSDFQTTLPDGRECLGMHGDGTTFPVWVSLARFRLGKRHLYAGIISDITRRKAVEMELRLAKAAAEEANRAKSEFLANMSHEMRTPMNAVLGFAQLMESDPLAPLSPDQMDSVQEIMRAGNHVLVLLNEVLDLAKIEAGRIQLSLEAVALRDILNACLSLIGTQARQRHITLIPPAETQGCAHYLVRADHTRLKQVVLNLLSNGVKYNREHGVLSIFCETIRPNRMRLWVADSGQGIPEDRLHEVFEPFNRLAAERSQVEGTGIGLVIVRRLITLMGGAIGVESIIGMGSAFWIELDVLELVEGDTPNAAACTTGAQRTPPPVRPRFTLLYVDDNPANLKLVERILNRRPDIRLITATDPLQGLELIHTRRPDLLLLDICLPVMSGYDVLSRLRQEEETRTLPVVAISANAMPEDVARGMAAGFVHYLTKPLQVDHFLDTLDAAIARRDQDAS
jgi:PAS domain S-box-containing protein